MLTLKENSVISWKDFWNKEFLYSLEKKQMAIKSLTVGLHLINFETSEIFDVGTYNLAGSNIKISFDSNNIRFTFSLRLKGYSEYPYSINVPSSEDPITCRYGKNTSYYSKKNYYLDAWERKEVHSFKEDKLNFFMKLNFVQTSSFAGDAKYGQVYPDLKTFSVYI